MNLRVSVSISTIAIAVLCCAMVGLAADPPIPIGVSVAQTGPVALAGQEQVLGAQIAEEDFNKHGGGHGRPLKLIFHDGGGDQPTAINSLPNPLHAAQAA